MLDLVGQLLAISFALRLFNGQSPQLTSATAAYLALFALVGLLSALGLLPVEALAMDSRLVREELQLWRLVSAFFSVDGIGTGFAVQLWMFGMYSSLLEGRHWTDNRKYAALWYTATLATGASQILLLATALSTSPAFSLAHSLTFFVIGLWSRSEPQRSVELFQLPVRAAFVPWCVLAMNMPLTGVEGALYNTIAIGVALMFESAIGLPPALVDSAKSGSAPPVRSAPHASWTCQVL